MTKILVTIILFLCQIDFIHGQERDSSINNKSKRLLPDSIKPLVIENEQNDSLYYFRNCHCCSNKGDTTNLPLLILDDIASSYFVDQFLISPQKIKEVINYNRKDAIAKYGIAAKNGAYFIELFDNVILFNLTQIFNKFGITGNDMALPVCVDDQYLPTAKYILVDLDCIKTVEIKEGTFCYFKSATLKASKYINIKRNR